MMPSRQNTRQPSRQARKPLGLKQAKEKSAETKVSLAGWKYFAAIDIGSNSVHLVVSRIDRSGNMEFLDSEKMSIRLGQELGSDGFISQLGFQKTIHAIKHMLEIAAPYKCTVKAVATFAVRSARNKEELIHAIQDETGVHVSVIDGQEEARLAFLGMQYGLDIENELTLGVDIGGGSTEIILARGDEIIFVTSLKLGAVTLSQNLFLGKAPTFKKIKKLEDYIYVRIAALEDEIKPYSFKRAVASSGTVKTVAGIDARLKKSALSDENGYQFSRENLDVICKKMVNLRTAKKISSELRVDPSRSEIILAGSLILQGLTKVLKIKTWTVTTYGLREGVVIDSFYRSTTNPIEKVHDIRWRSVKHFADRVGIRRSFAEKSRQLCASMFDQLALQSTKKLSPEYLKFWREIFEAAAYLSEVGKFVGYSGFHKHSYYLISYSRLLGFTEFERLLISLIVRFHRKSSAHRNFAGVKDLSSSDFKQVKVLSTFLRIAVALNRTRRDLIQDVKLKFSEKAITATLIAEGKDKIQAEILSLEQEVRVIEENLDRSFEIQVRTRSHRVES